MATVIKYMGAKMRRATKSLERAHVIFTVCTSCICVHDK